MDHDAWFFVGIFLFIFLIWASTGGPARQTTLTGPSLNQSRGSGDTNLNFPRASFNISRPISSSASGDNGSSYSRSSAIKTLQGITFGNPSIYRDTVLMGSRISGASSTNPGNEYVQLSMVHSASSPVNISGWTLVSEITGKAALIPQGTPVPTSGIINHTQNIILSPGEQAIVITGRSPLGTSFRENMCTGYLSTFQQFTPSLPKKCPLPSAELVKYYGPYYIRDTTCVDYVKTLSRCETVLFPPSTLSPTCKTFVKTHLNYNGCVLTHSSESDFNGTTWRIYLGYSDSLWRSKNEILKLFDLSSHTVDAISY